MKKFFNFIFIISLTVLVFSGCEDKTDLTAPAAPSPKSGNADLTRFVTIGNSLTAGYQSGALYQSAQIYSFGNQIAKQVGTTFEQPLVSDPGVGGRMVIESLNLATHQITIGYDPSSGVPLNLNYQAPYNNLGVPGALLYDVLNATDSTNCASALFANSPNPLFNLILRGIGTQFQQAKMLHPTFVTLWIGNNDVLGFATSGGFSPPAPTPVTGGPYNFTDAFNALADSIASLGANVVVANIPNVTSIPFFTTVGPIVGQTLSALSIPAMYYQHHGEYSGTALPVSSLMNYSALITLVGQTYAGLIGTPTGKFYRDHNVDITPLIAAGILDTTKLFGLDPKNPWPDALILDPDEINTALTATAAYNGVIQAAATAHNFGVVDINTIFNNIRQADATGGVVFNGVTFSTTYITGGLFGLDGVHPTSQGQAILANEFIKVINSKFGASFPLIDVSTIPGSIVLAKRSYSKLPYFEPGAFKHLLY